MSRLSQAVQGYKEGWPWRKRIYSSAEGTEPAPRTAANGMRQHVRYVVLGVVQAVELKELRTQVGAACSGFLEEEKREKGVLNNHPG